MKRFVVVMTVWAMGLAGVLAGVVFPSSASAAPTTAGDYVSVTPSRLLNTLTGVGAPKAAVPGRDTVHLKVTDTGGVPAGVSAVVLNVAVVAPTSAGYITVHAGGTVRPTASNLNFVKGQTVPNLVIAPVSTGGIVDLYNGSDGTTHLVADVSGYFVAGAPTTAGAYVSVPPSRSLNSLTGVGAPKAAVPARDTVHLKVTDTGGIPAGVSAVVLNVAAVAPTSAGYITVHAGGTVRPTASNLNFVKGQTATNLVIAPVSTDGIVDLHNGSDGTTHLVADVSGYFVAGASTTAGAFGPVPPSRLLNSLTGVGAPKAAVPARDTVHLKVTDTGGVPAGVSAVVLNVAAVAPTSAGYITVHAGGTVRPTASNLNFVKGETATNLVIAPVSSTGIVDLYNGSDGTVHLVADVAGYYLDADADVTAPGPVTDLTVAADGAHSVHLIWNNPIDADFTGVTIVRKPGAVAPVSITDGIVVADTAKGISSYDDAVLTGEWSYALFAHDAAGNHAAGLPGTTDTTPADVTPPGPVTNVTANLDPVDGTKIALSWTNPTGDFDKVMIRRLEGAVPPATVIAGTEVLANTATTAIDTGIAGTQYSYAVFALDVAGNPSAVATASATAKDTVAPAPVTLLTAEAGDGLGNAISLRWTNPTDTDFTGVMIRRSEGAIAPATATDGTLFTDLINEPVSYVTDNVGVNKGTQYSYALFAHDAANNYAAGVNVTFTTTGIPEDLTVPGPVTSVTATALSATSIRLDWVNPVDLDFTGVRILRAVGGTAPHWDHGSVVAETGPADTSFTDTGLIEGELYTYGLYAHDAVGNHTVAAVNVTMRTVTAAPIAVLSYTNDAEWFDFDASLSTVATGNTMVGTLDYGDGTPVEPLSDDLGWFASHTYAAPGDYDVTLTVTDSVGVSHSMTLTVTVAPGAVVPTATITGPPGPVSVGADVEFTLSTTGSAVAFWTVVGDSVGFYESGFAPLPATVTHAFAEAGTYTVSFSFTNVDGGQAEASMVVTVEAPVAP